MRKVVAVAVLLAGCLGKTTYRCDDSAQCVLAGTAGTCEPTHACSFPDDACAAGRSYGPDSPADLAGTCVIDDVHVTVTPSTDAVLADTTTRLAATLTGSADTAITWTVVEAGGGTIASDGRYRAPMTAGTYHVRATSHANPERSGEAAITVATSAAPVVIASAPAARAIGYGFQPHLIHATGAQQWWLFADDSAAPTRIRTRFSSDFASWSDGDALTLPHAGAGDARNLVVAYRALGGHDVVHLSRATADPDAIRYHARAIVSPGAIALGAPVPFGNGAANDPDGTACVITAGGAVVDSTGWQGTPPTPDIGNCGYGDVVSYESRTVDDGGASDITTWDEHVQWCVPNTVNARQLLADAETVYELYVDGTDGANPVDILMNVRFPDGTWLPLPVPGTTVRPYDAFPGPPARAMDLGDWMAALVDGEVHVVRRLRATPDSYEHAIFSLTSRSWRPGAAVPALAAAVGSGLFLAPYGDGMILASIDAGGDGVIRYSFWDGAAWSAWHPLIANPGVRTSIGGAVPDDGTPPALVWMQVSGSTYNIVGAALP
ncbi:MAG: hypothetical protein K8W52_05060 [Deltaproteobacteria bacterium]|nr:hypothetical protein [Deltaproteobacteria bacterium]